MGDLQHYLAVSATIPGWTRRDEAEALTRISFALADGPTVVEIGSFLGSGTVLMAGPRRLRGSGKVHCVDPFDCSGDPFSAPQYRQILDGIGGGTLRDRFDGIMERVGLSDWVEVHQGGAREIAATWNAPIDLLFLDGDQSPAGAREAFECWAPFLKRGGFIAVHNSHPAERAAGHDGYYRIAVEEIQPPAYSSVTLIGSTTFARKATPDRLTMPV